VLCQCLIEFLVHQKKNIHHHGKIFKTKDTTMGQSQSQKLQDHNLHPQNLSAYPKYLSHFGRTCEIGSNENKVGAFKWTQKFGAHSTIPKFVEEENDFHTTMPAKKLETISLFHSRLLHFLCFGEL
jgi:hypothetical protein